MCIEVPHLSQEILRDGTPGGEESSEQIRKQVIYARNRSVERCARVNVLLAAHEVTKYCQLNDAGHDLIEQVVYKLGLSDRAHHRMLKFSRTIANINNSTTIELNHPSEAIGYRRLDRLF